MKRDHIYIIQFRSFTILNGNCYFNFYCSAKSDKLFLCKEHETYCGCVEAAGNSILTLNVVVLIIIEYHLFFYCNEELYSVSVKQGLVSDVQD